MNFFQKFRGFVFSPTHTRTVGVLITGIVTISVIGLTVVTSQQQQDLRQRATSATEDCDTMLASCNADYSGCDAKCEIEDENCFKSCEATKATCQTQYDKCLTPATIITPTSETTVTPILTPTASTTPTQTPIGAPTAASTPTPLSGYHICSQQFYSDLNCKVKGSSQLTSCDNWHISQQDKCTATAYESFYISKCQPCSPSSPSTPTLTPTPLSVSTPAPTATSGGTSEGSLTPGSTPASIQLALTLTQEGLATRPAALLNRPVIILLQKAGSAIIQKTGSVSYDSDGKFSGSINLGALPTGSYKMKVKAGSFLQSPTVDLNISGTTVIAPPTKLTVGLADQRTTLTNQDNIDPIPFYDKGLRACFGSTIGIKKCDNPQDVDLNGDGKVDGIDLNAYIKGLYNYINGLPI